MSNVMMTINDLKTALKNDEFIFYYQPKVSMITGDIIGAEALIRWQKQSGEIIPPSDFIPLAESTGFISDITNAMFKKLIVDVMIFEDIEGDFVVSINASSKDFIDSTFVDHIRVAIETKQIKLGHIEVELTESSLLEESDVIHENFSALVTLGVDLVMDDFGTGFSSIDLLSKLPFSTVKLDQGVVSRMECSEKNQTIVESSIRMGHQLGLNIVAEGIETEEVYLTLQSLGCTIAQGYWISKPLPIADFLELVRQKKRWPSTALGLLYMAQLDHIHWRKSLIDSVFSMMNNSAPMASFRGSLTTDSHSCMLGKWYYGAGRIYANISAYAELEEPHKQLHDLGNALVIAVENKTEKEKLVEMMRELSKLSGVIIKLLQDIESELV